MNRIVVDVGNSRVSMAVAVNGTLSEIEHVPTFDPESASQRIIETARQKDASVAIASVVPRAASRLISRLSPEVENVVELTTLNQRLVKGIYPTMGIDRVANLAAAFSLFGQDGGAIVLDFGTATTLSSVDQDGCFQGGWITLGLGSTLKALGEYTGQLPDLSGALTEGAPVTLAKSTDEAIVHGTLLAHAGIVRQWLAAAKRALPQQPTVIATGGYANLIAPFTREIDSVEPNLTLMGINLIAEAAVPTDPA